MEFIESNGIEKDILLCISKTKSISEISKELNKPIQTISTTINRMLDQDIIIKVHDYLSDARKTEVSINKKKVRIKKTHTFYLVYFAISVFVLFSSFLALLFKKTFFVLGTVWGVLLTFIYMLYNVYITKDKIIVEKKVKSNKKR